MYTNWHEKELWERYAKTNSYKEAVANLEQKDKECSQESTADSLVINGKCHKHTKVK